ncbi:hypothetical protein IQ268_08690 [Oculatella sp. LEGE 06141]|uniref:hypothetical protein n=1 Tax=Oculatella sp. LEGE 06141 TaxID=1828648 RepID=UPI00187FFE53|nr:hypothetical protein [Oculatella sp. LEGE 06141]MBE9178635.1 hypothetical protein [Oculatella sp. LEGE 06141]
MSLFQELQSNTSRKNWAQRNPMLSLALVATAAIAAMNHQNILENMKASEVRAQQIKANAALSAEAEASTLFAEQQAAIAEGRYVAGCMFIYFADTPNQYANVAVGARVVDPVDGSPLPPGTVVCDANGNTAILDGNSKISLPAYTGNKAIVREAEQRQFAEGTYSNPVRN